MKQPVAIVQSVFDQDVREINALETRIVRAEDDADENLWEQARQVVALLEAGLTQRKLAAQWINARTGEAYGHVHVHRVARVYECFASETPRPRFREAFQKVAHSQREPKPTPEFPDGTFSVLYVDPPWAYNNSGFHQSAAQHYDTLPVDAISNFVDKDGRAVSSLAHDGSVLFLWATSPLLPAAVEVMEKWGFDYRTSLVWRKDKAPPLGWWARTYHELLLVGVKPFAPQPATKPNSVIDAPVSQHSAKPPIFAETIEAMYPGPKDGTFYVELFSRQPRDGWAAFGNEVSTEE